MILGMMSKKGPIEKYCKEMWGYSEGEKPFLVMVLIHLGGLYAYYGDNVTSSIALKIPLLASDVIDCSR